MSMMLCPVCGPAAPNLGAEIIGKRAQKTIVLAYAADVTIFMTPTDLPVIRIDIQCYENATGESLNAKKLKDISSGRMEYNHGYSGHTIPHRSKYSRRHLHENHRAVNEQDLSERNRQG
jgi:ribosomal protein L35